MRWTVAGLTPWSGAIERTLQWAASFGVLCRVLSARAASCSGVISLWRPRLIAFMANRLHHLLLVTLADTSDPLSWSGTPFGLRRALEKQVDRVTVLDRLWFRKPKRTLPNVVLRVLLGGKPARYPLWMTAAALKSFARSVGQAIAENRPQAVISVATPSCMVELGPQGIPVAMFSDAPWLAWKEAYEQYERMPLLGPSYARKEAAAAGRCDALFFASKWATNEARSLYGVPEDRLHVTPLGACWVPDLGREELLSRIRARDRKVLKLLFIGRDWGRKGGPLAVEVAKQLNESGQQTELHIVGCNPEIDDQNRDVVRIEGPLRTSVPGEHEKMRRLFLDSHFLVVPTEAECFGLVFAEALAHGLPAVSRRVHAVPSIIDDGVNGILENRTTPAAPYAARILRTFRDPAQYESMAVTGRDKYESSLTWDACAKKIVATLDGLVREPENVKIWPASAIW